MPLPLTRNCLSDHDRQVLDSIFNPLELTSTTTQAIDALTDAATLRDNDDEQAAVSDNVRESIELEIAAVKLAEQNNLAAALEKFAAALCASPHRASVLNNRAQVLRLAGRDDEALADLNAALELCDTNWLRTKCNALCQRGVLRRKADNLDAAREDFEAAAALGSKFAKEQLVEINPYAALCNQMLRQAFEQLK